MRSRRGLRNVGQVAAALCAFAAAGGFVIAAAAPPVVSPDRSASAAAVAAAFAAASAPLDVPLHDCRIAGLPHSVRCGVLGRPLDPSHPETASIGVHLVVVPAVSRRKLPDPVFFLAGGPGQSAIDLAAQTMPLFSRLNNRRDIVFIDQRGTGRSEPLDCPDDPRAALGEAASATAQYALLMRCKTELEARPRLRTPGALGFFTTPLAVQDLDAVRRLLGAERIDLVGVSYGTRVALETLRQFPGTVRRAVLDSVAPPDMALPASFSTDAQSALEALLAACAREPACHAAFPALRAAWDGLLTRLPRTVQVHDPLSGQPEAPVLTRDAVLSLVRGALYSPALAAALPTAIDAAAHGRYEPLVGLGGLLQSRRGGKLALGMHFSVVCAEDVPALDRPRSAALADPPGADFGTASAALYRKVCASWPRGAVPAAFYSVPPTPADTLLLAGGVDPATPPRHAARMARALGPKAQLVVVPNGGHNLLAVGCAPDLLFRYLDAPEGSPILRALDAECLRRVPRPPVFLPARPLGRASEAPGAAR